MIPPDCHLAHLQLLGGELGSQHNVACTIWIIVELKIVKWILSQIHLKSPQWAPGLCCPHWPRIGRYLWCSDIGDRKIGHDFKN